MEEVLSIGGHLGRWLLEVECWHGSSMQHREVDGNRHRTTALTLMAGVHATGVKVWVNTEMILLIHSDVRRVRSREVRLGGWSNYAHGG